MPGGKGQCEPQDYPFVSSGDRSLPKESGVIRLQRGGSRGSSAAPYEAAGSQTVGPGQSKAMDRSCLGGRGRDALGRSEQKSVHEIDQVCGRFGQEAVSRIRKELHLEE